MFGMFKKAAKKSSAANKAAAAFSDTSSAGPDQRAASDREKKPVPEREPEGDHAHDDEEPDAGEESAQKSRRSSTVVIGGRLGEVAPVEAPAEESEEGMDEEEVAADGSGFEEDDPMLKEAIIEHCKYLGIDPVTQSEYVWIAKKSMLAPVPEGWEQVIDDNGVPFYHNLGSGESQWEHPDDEHYRQMFQKLLEEEKKPKASKIAKGKGKTSDDKGAEDKASGKKSANQDEDGAANKELDESAWDDWDDIEDEAGQPAGSAKGVVVSDGANSVPSTSKAESEDGGRKSALMAQQSAENAEWDDWDSGDEEADGGETASKTASKTAKMQQPKTTTTPEDADANAGESVPKMKKKDILESGMFPLKDDQDHPGKKDTGSSGDAREESAAGRGGKTSAKEMFVAQAEIKRLTGELEHSQSRLEKSKDDQDQLASKHRQSIEDIRNDLMASQDRAHAAERKTTEVKVELERVQDELSVYRRQHEGIQSSKAGLEDQLSTLKANKSRMEQTISTLRKQVSDLQTSLQRVGRDQDEELATVKGELKTLKEDNKKIKTELEEVKSLNNTLSASTNRRIQNSMQTARSAQAARKAAEEREKALEKELSALKAGVSKTSKTLESELEAALKRLKKAEAAKSNAEDLAEEEASKSRQNIKDLQRQLAESREGSTGREKDLMATVERLKKEIAGNDKKEVVSALQTEVPAKSQKVQDSSEAQEMKKMVAAMKMKLEVTERKLRDAERLTSAAEERADRAESTATETNVENELATSLGIRVYELERDKDKLEATIRDAAADRDLFKTQAEAALRERSQVLDRIKVEQQRNDELVFQRQRLSEEKIKLSAQLEQARLIEERAKEEITTLQDRQNLFSNTVKVVEEDRLRVDELLRVQKDKMKKEHDTMVESLRKDLMEERLKSGGSSSGPDLNSSAAMVGLENQLRSEYELRILALQDEIQSLQSGEKPTAESSANRNVSSSLISSQIQENKSLRAQIQTLQDQIRRIKRNGEDEINSWKRRASDLSAEAEALRLERNERKVELKELREEWKMLHKELRDVKVQELVARETAMRAEAKLEKNDSTDENVSRRMNSFLGDMRTLVEQVASFQRSPARALMDTSSYTNNVSYDGKKLSFSPARNEVAPPPPVPRYQLHRSSGAPGLPNPVVDSGNTRLLNLSNSSDAAATKFTRGGRLDPSEKTMQSLMERVESERVRSANARREVEMLRAALHDQQQSNHNLR